MKKTTATGLLGLLFSSPIYADTLNAEPVTVTASGIHDDIQNIPSNVQVISKEEIQEINALSIPQILSQLGGLNITGTVLGQFNQGATIDIGGYGATAGSNTLILINGQRISPIDSSSAPWEMILVESIDRIEIIKSSASVQFGDRADGGVINIVTNEGQQSIQKATLTVGSFGTLGTNAIYQNRYNDTLLKLVGTANHSDGWRENSASDQVALNARLTQFFDTDNVYIEFFGNHNKNGTPGAVLGEVGQGNSSKARCDNNSCYLGAFNSYDNYGVSAGNKNQLTSNILFESDVSYKNTHSYFDQPLGIFGPYSATYDKSRIEISPRFKVNLQRLGEVILGYSYSHSNAASKDPYGNPSVSLMDNSAFFEYRLPLINHLEFNTGYRRQIENIKASSDQKTSSANAWDIALNYKYAEGSKAYVKYDQSFRFANVDEFLAYDDGTYDHTHPHSFIGTILSPQNDQTAEIGSSLLLGDSTVTASIFHKRTQHEIRLDLNSSDSTFYQNINDPHTIERNGIFISTISCLTDRMTLYTNAKLQDARYQGGSYDGKSVDLVPHWLFNARLNYQVFGQWSLGAVMNHVGSQYYDGANDNSAYRKIPSYTVGDIYVNRKYEHWDVSLTARNITNEHYATYGGYSSSRGYYYYPSDPRSLLASISYRF
jgi:iron complex outermembrane recepter protein